MKPEDIEYYEDLDTMFATNGWRRLVEDLKKEIYGLQASALEVASWDLVNFARGQATALNYIANLEAIAFNQRKQKELDAIEDVAEAQ